jgi:hypothetical protein
MNTSSNSHQNSGKNKGNEFNSTQSFSIVEEDNLLNAGMLLFTCFNSTEYAIEDFNENMIEYNNELNILMT